MTVLDRDAAVLASQYSSKYGQSSIMASTVHKPSTPPLKDDDAARVHDSSSEGEGDFQAIDPHSGVKRGLKTRHVSMMALVCSKLFPVALY